KHPMLRLTITAEGQQHILPLSACHQLTVEDITRYSKQETEQFLHNKRERMSHQILDLNQSSPIEISVTLLANNEHRLHIDADMIACDAQSFRIVVEDLARLYLSAQESDLAVSEEPQLTYFHYLDHQQTDRYLAQRKASDKQWWQTRLLS
ncbi:condensation domain-containing protein, partial [Vibrio fluvialis]